MGAYTGLSTGVVDPDDKRHQSELLPDHAGSHPQQQLAAVSFEFFDFDSFQFPLGGFEGQGRSSINFGT